MNPTNPFEPLFTGIGDFFNDLLGEGPPQDGATLEWDPLEHGQIRLRYTHEPAPVFSSSVREHLRNASTPRLIPIVDAATHASVEIGTYGSLKAGTAAAVAASAGTPPSGNPGKPGAWTRTNAQWLALNDYQKAAAMALLEADKADPENARHALAAMVNRASQRKAKLGEHVSSRSYQPTFEPAQEARLGRILANPKHQELTEWGQRYAEGHEDDPTGGATHFLAHPRVMLSLEAQNPRKYRSWRSWTGFDAASGTYQNQTFNDHSHAFLAPEGRYSVPRLYK